MKWLSRRGQYTPAPHALDVPVCPQLLMTDITVPIPDTPPHCDSDVLHGPGQCRFCDAHPDIQANRIRQHVRFTGDAEPVDWLVCPSELFRSPHLIARWPGNQAYPAGAPGPRY